MHIFHKWSNWFVYSTSIGLRKQRICHTCESISDRPCVNRWWDDFSSLAKKFTWKDGKVVD